MKPKRNVKKKCQRIHSKWKRSKNIQEKENPNKKGKYKDKDHLNKAVHRSKQKQKIVKATIIAINRKGQHEDVKYNTCKSMADLCQCMAKTTTIL